MNGALQVIRILIFFSILLNIKAGSAEMMIDIPAGSFLMGAPDVTPSRSRREVFLKRFSIDRFEVTNAEFQAVFPENTYPAGKDRHPVSFITWAEASAYCKAVGKRLPTAAEWEKAARGTDGRAYPWGENRNRKRPHPAYSGMVKRVVGFNKKDTSPYGVRDMAASVWEWTVDEADDKKIARGGVWNHHLDFEYSTTYDHIEIAPERRFIFLGFRCVR
ncbi:MAG: formylglycine-generating enzyme family protein [Nitrospiria bacterium]